MNAKQRAYIALLAVAALSALAFAADAAAPVVTGPQATTSARQPTISWTSVPGATWHRIWIASGPPGFTTAYHDEWITGTTSWKPDWDLPVGQYVVWVMAWGKNIDGGWSGPHGFARENPSIVSSIDGVYHDGGNIDLVAGANVTITPDNANNRITISASPSGGGTLGDITAVLAGAGLTGGGTSGDVTLRLAQNSVSSSEVVDNSLNASDLGANSVGASEIAAGAVGNSEIASDAVGTSELVNGSVLNVDLANNAVTSGKIADGNVTSADIQNNTVTSTDIANGSIQLEDLTSALAQQLVPVGTILAFGGETPPSGWWICDGRAVSRSTYPALYNAIGHSWGGNTSSFRLPELRGMFLRGWNSGRTDDWKDPSIADREASATGGNTGNHVGSRQRDAFESHNHSFYDTFNRSELSDNADDRTVGSDSNTSTLDYTHHTGSAETRPMNAYVNYIIKY